MALSDYERQMLEQLEAQLTDDDPHLAESLAKDERAEQTTVLSAKHVAVGLIVAVIGLLTVVGGVAIENIFVGALGFIVVFAGMWYLFAGFKKVPATGARRKQPRSPHAHASFMDRQREEWRKRQQGR